METVDYSKTSIEIPEIYLNTVTFSVDDDGGLNYWYGINDKKNSNLAEKVLRDVELKYTDKKRYLYYDFRKKSKMEEKKWFYENGINIYQNSDVKVVWNDQTDGLIDNNDTHFEKVYWLRLINK